MPWEREKMSWERERESERERDKEIFGKIETERLRRVSTKT